MSQGRRTNPHGLCVGQELFYVGSQYNHPLKTHVTVKSVGRKWASLSNNLRIDLSSLRADGGEYSSPGRAYISATEYTETAAKNDAWRFLRREIDRLHSCPTGLTIEKMDQIADLLGIDRSEA